MFPSVLLMRFPKEMLGVDIPVKKKTGIPSKTWIYSFFYIGKVIGGLNLKKSSQPAFSVHL